MEQWFSHEKLRVYQEAIAFVSWWEEVSTSIPGRLPAKDQLDRASTSIPLNIAEGNGRSTTRDRSHFFSIARGSALECAACLDVLVAKGSLTPQEIEPGKRHLHAVVSMLQGLVGSDATRVAEEEAVWCFGSRLRDAETRSDYENENDYENDREVGGRR